MIKTLQQLADLLHPFRRRFYLYLAIVFVYETAQVLNSYSLPAVIRLFDSGVSIGWWIALFVGLEIFDCMFRYLDHWLDWHIVAKLIYPINKHIKMMVVKIFLQQDAAWHQRNNSGILIGKANNGTQKVEDMVDTLAWEFIPTLTQSLLTLPPLIYCSPGIAGIVLVSLALFILITRQGEKFRLPLRKSRHDIYEMLWQGTEEAVKAYETLAIYGQTQRVIREHERLNDDATDTGLREARRTIYRYHEWRAAVIQHTSRLVLLLLLLQLKNGTISLPEMFFVYTLSDRLLNAFWRFARLMQRVGESKEGIARLHHLSSQRPEITDGPHTRHDLKIPDELQVEFRNVSFAYPGHEKEVISGLNLIIHQGDQLAVVGPSGSGKTTLRRLMLRLFEVKSGEILISGVPLREWPLELLRSLFAYVPQGDEVSIFDDTIEANIRLSRPEAARPEVELAARQAGLLEFIQSLPENFSTRVGEKGIKLSGGQKQRLAVARAILSGRRFLILDEATSSVDVVTEQSIMRELQNVQKGITSVTIAHRMPTIRHADRIVVLKGGQKVAEGTHDDLMNDKGGLYRTMVHLHVTHQL